MLDEYCAIISTEKPRLAKKLALQRVISETVAHTYDISAKFFSHETTLHGSCNNSL